MDNGHMVLLPDFKFQPLHFLNSVVMARHQVIVRDKFETSSRNGNGKNSRYDLRVIKISPQAQQLRQSRLDYCYLGRECDVFNAAKYPDISENPIYHRFKGPCLISTHTVLYGAHLKKQNYLLWKEHCCVVMTFIYLGLVLCLVFGFTMLSVTVVFKVLIIHIVWGIKGVQE